MERKNKIPVTRINRWYDDDDFKLELDMAKEVIEEDMNFTVVLFQIDKAHSNHDIYMENDTQEMRFFPPVELKVASLKIEKAENKSYNEGGNGSLRYQEFGNLTFTILKEQLTAKGVDINYGDIIGYAYDENNIKYFEVNNDGKISWNNENTHFGYKSYFRHISCVTVDPNRFNGL